MMLVSCTFDHVKTTLEILAAAGQLRKECVVLWLGKRRDDGVRVEEVYRPQQEAEEDMFHIPPASMGQLYTHMRAKRFMVAAQVHSHPGPAFHSLADDRWAIIRHEGALSLVIPHFAARTTTANFFNTTKMFQFSSHCTWDEVAQRDVRSWLEIR